MAKEIRTKTAKSSFKKSFHSPFFIYWDKLNYILFGTGLLLLIIGFYVISLGNWDSTTSISIAPVILFIAYVIVFPMAIFLRTKKLTTEGEEKVAAGQS